MPSSLHEGGDLERDAPDNDDLHDNEDNHDNEFEEDDEFEDAIGLVTRRTVVGRHDGTGQGGFGFGFGTPFGAPLCNSDGIWWTFTILVVLVGFLVIPKIKRWLAG